MEGYAHDPVSKLEHPEDHDNDDEDDDGFSSAESSSPISIAASAPSSDDDEVADKRRLGYTAQVRTGIIYSCNFIQEFQNSDESLCVPRTGHMKYKQTGKRLEQDKTQPVLDPP